MASDTEGVSEPAPAPKKVKRVIRKKRPARVQMDPALAKDIQAQPQVGTTFNIWYNKWAGGDREDNVQTAARSRCNLARDSGYTKADSHPGSFICLHFARGLCHRGQDCDYLHRRPTIFDRFPPHVDAFGRDKFSGYRDDMGGVGSFLRQNRTIYVGKIHTNEDVEEVVARHFAEWGEVERIRVLNTRGVAFITYKTEAMADFAKEAMAHQSLDHNEILNVRWATEDPNPMAQKREARRIEEQAAEAIRRALPADFVAQIEGKDPEARKRRKIESSYGLEGYEAPDEVHFARGPEAVNPSGRQALVEGRQAQQPMIEGAPPEGVGGEGIFSSSTLAALDAARVAVAPKPDKTASPKALVAYESDSE